MISDAMFQFGPSPAMKNLAARADSIARSLVPILVEGEAGTGKEALALELHRRSGLPGGFVRVVCGVGDAEVLGAEIFGLSGTPGRLQQAAEGTLFFKNLHLLPETLQERLLAALEGLPRENFQAAVRPVASAAEPLEQRVASGRFLPALYFQLSVCRLALPPLRERPEDIAPLFAALTAGFPMPECGRPLPPRVMNALRNYPWPGNVRELLSLARGYAVLGDAGALLAEFERRAAALQPRPSFNGGSLREQVREATRRLESEIILRALERHRWNRRRAADSLKISYRALLYKMKNCELPDAATGREPAP